MLPENAFRKAIANPSRAVRWGVRKIRRNLSPYLAARRVNQMYHRRYREPGNLDVMNEDWDLLILIDACRFDYFKEINQINGDLQKKKSPASMSLGFIEKSYIGRELHDTVYLTANPFVGQIPDETFYDVVSFADQYIDNDVETVPPETMAEATREALDDYPNKRVISHFMQPHEPFLTEFGQQVSEQLYWNGNQYFPGENSGEEVRQAYRENIDYTLDIIKELVADVSIETVISSDHGELMGERIHPVPIQGWEHPESLYSSGLIEVPWLRIPGKRREITSGNPHSLDINTDAIEDRLANLGYR